MNLKHSFDRLLGDRDAIDFADDAESSASLDPAAFISEPQVTTQPDGTLVFSVTAPCLVEDSIAVEREGDGTYKARAEAVETFEHHGVPADFLFVFVLTPETSGDPTWAYVDCVLHITIPPR